MTSGQRVIEAQVIIKRKHNADTSSSRPATITATPGKIEIVSIGGKFPPIRVSTEALSKFKRPQGKTVNWASLDFIPNIDAKYSYVNVQVELARMDELVETLTYAWTSKPVVDVFADNADEAFLPVHKPAPNATNPTRTQTGRSTMPRVKVDEEGSAAHPDFANDFGPTRKGGTQKTDSLRGIWEDDKKKEVEAMPVHTKPPVKSNRLPANLNGDTSRMENKSKQTSTLINLLRDGEEVVKQTTTNGEKKVVPPPTSRIASMGMASSPKNSMDGKRSEGIGERSFYGKEQQKTSVVPSKAPSSEKRMSTKDSLDASRMLSRGVRMTPGIRDRSGHNEFLKDKDEDEEDDKDLPSSYQPPMNSGERIEEKSLTTNPPYRPPFNSFQLSNGRLNSMVDTRGYIAPWGYKKQENIGNSCYMNSTMQVLAACPIFVSQLISVYETLQKLKGTDRISSTFKIFSHLMKYLTGSFPEKVVPKLLLEKMRNQVKTLDAIFEENGGMAQQDAEECLTAVLGAISDECTGKGFRKRDSLSRRSVGGGGVSPVKRVDPETGSSQVTSGEGEDKKEKAYPAGLDPVDLMEVKMRDVKKCNSCGDTNEKEAVEHRVHLVVEEEKRRVPWTVKCVQQLLAAEVAQQETIGDFKCEKCLQKCEATGTKQFVEFGEYIIIVLKRFGYDENLTLRKLNTPIRVPLYLEAADLTDEKRIEMHDETIVLHDEKGEKPQTKSRRKTMEVASPLMKVMDTTKDWLEEKEEGVNTQVTQAGEMEGHDSFFDNDGGGDMEEEVEGGFVKEDAMEMDKDEEREEKTATKEEEVIVISESSQSDGEETAGKSTAVAGDGEKKPSRRTITTPFIKSGRIETPPSMMIETKRRSDIDRVPTTTPCGKRDKRLRTGSERENRVSTGSRPSLCFSEPSKTEKKSRLEGRRRRSKEETSPVSNTWTIVDVDDEEEKPRRLSDTKPCWKESEPEKEKEKRKSNEHGDPYEFDDEEEKNEKQSGRLEKKNRTSKLFNPPVKRPLGHQNGPPQGSPMKGEDRIKRQKSENVDPSPIKMEQTGGGKRKNEADKNAPMSDDEGNGMEENGEGRKIGAEIRLDHVTRRSKVREEKMKKEVKNEEGEGEMSQEKEETEEAREEEEGNIMSRGSKEDEEETSEEVVHDTPPDEMEEGGNEEKEEEEEMGNGDGVEEEEGEGELFIDEGEETANIEGAPVTGDEFLIGDSESRVFDTPKNHESHGISSQDCNLDQMESTEEDGEVRVPLLTPNCSPVKKEGEGKKKEREEEQKEREELPEIIEEKAELKYNRNVYRKEWRRLFIDTDPAPLRDHFMFRPVDDRWMKGQCLLLKLKYNVNSCDQSILKRLRAQSSLCKITAKPDSNFVEEIDGDGNCLFRSISWWVTGTEDAHAELREKIVNFMCCFPDEFGERMSGDKGQKYTKEENNRMLEVGEWGTHCEIYGAATLLGVDIYTYHDKRWKQYRPLFDWCTEEGEYKVTRKTGLNERTRFGLYLSNPENYHYDTVTYMEPVVPVSNTSYRLLGTILHRGATACSGHYVADVFDQEKNQWLHCDDDKIKKRTVIEVLENAMDEGYVLVYGKSDSVVKTH